MATYNSHRLIMGKVEIDIFCNSLEIFEKKFTDMFIELSSKFHMFYFVCLFKLMLYVHGKQLGSCRDGQLSYPHCS